MPERNGQESATPKRPDDDDQRMLWQLTAQELAFIKQEKRATAVFVLSLYAGAFAMAKPASASDHWRCALIAGVVIVALGGTVLELLLRAGEGRTRREKNGARVDRGYLPGGGGDSNVFTVTTISVILLGAALVIGYLSQLE